MTIQEAKAHFEWLLSEVEAMRATPWPFLCASAMIEYLAKMVDDRSASDADKYTNFVTAYFTQVDSRYQTFRYGSGEQDLPTQMYHILRCGIVHSFSLSAGPQQKGRSGSIVIAHEGSHLTSFTDLGRDAARFVLNDFARDIGKVVERIFEDAKNDVSLAARIEKRIKERPPIALLEASVPITSNQVGGSHPSRAVTRVCRKCLPRLRAWSLFGRRRRRFSRRRPTWQLLRAWIMPRSGAIK